MLDEEGRITVMGAFSKFIVSAWLKLCWLTCLISGLFNTPGVGTVEIVEHIDQEHPRVTPARHINLLAFEIELLANLIRGGENWWLDLCNTHGRPLPIPKRVLNEDGDMVDLEPVSLSALFQSARQEEDPDFQPEPEEEEESEEEEEEEAPRRLSKPKAGRQAKRRRGDSEEEDTDGAARKKQAKKKDASAVKTGRKKDKKKKQETGG